MLGSPRVSIVIPTYNRPESLRECLGALMSQLPSQYHPRILVVDDESVAECRDRNAFICKELGCRYEVNRKHKGVSAARNWGVQSTTGEWIAFLDDDVVVNRGWYSSLSRCLMNVDTDVVGIEGAVHAQGSGIWDREVHNTRGGLYLTCNIAYRRATLQAIGGFDEEFLGPFGEDQELAIRAREKGRILFCHDLSVTHLRRKINPISYLSATPKRVRAYLFSELHFYKKHPLIYGEVRHAKTFWGTYLALLTRGLLINFRRRKISQMAHHPLQTITLVLSSLLEQATALASLHQLLARARTSTCQKRPTEGM